MIIISLIILLVINVISFITIIFSYRDKNEYMHSLLEKNILNRNYLNDLNNKILENQTLTRSYISDLNSSNSKLRTYFDSLSQDQKNDASNFFDFLSKINTEFKRRLDILSKDSSEILTIFKFREDRILEKINSIESSIKSLNNKHYCSKPDLSKEDKQKITANDYDTRNASKITTPLHITKEIKRKPGRPKKVKK